MAVLAASNNEGKYNRVHRQTDDGLVISVIVGDDLVPLIFGYKDYLGCFEESLLSAAFFPHKHLMRGDCGVVREDDSEDLLFSWNAMDKVIDGMSAGPSGEYIENYHEAPNCAKDVRIDGLKSHRTTFYRKDRAYWTPGKTLQADTTEPLFGFTQWNPLSCPPKHPDKCGIVNFYDKCDKKKKG